MVHSTVDTFPGGSRSYTLILTSVLWSDSVLRWLPELLRDGLGRVDEEDMLECGASKQARASQ